ncbi:MAG TPA: hypothetical protein VLU46_03800 [Thermoanaerobaculia bacterium]|nr:hypothetical protein [Thermoanaerobaculia bacterium]
MERRASSRVGGRGRPPLHYTRKRATSSSNALALEKSASSSRLKSSAMELFFCAMPSVVV